MLGLCTFLQLSPESTATLHVWSTFVCGHPPYKSFCGVKYISLLSVMLAINFKTLLPLDLPHISSISDAGNWISAIQCARSDSICVLAIASCFSYNKLLPYNEMSSQHIQARLLSITFRPKLRPKQPPIQWIKAPFTPFNLLAPEFYI